MKCHRDLRSSKRLRDRSKKSPWEHQGREILLKDSDFSFFFSKRGCYNLDSNQWCKEKKMFASSLQLRRITCNFTSNFIAFYQTLPQYFFIFAWLLIWKGTDKQSFFLCCCTCAQHALGYALLIMSFSKDCGTVQHHTELLHRQIWHKYCIWVLQESLWNYGCIENVYEGWKAVNYSSKNNLLHPVL